MDNPFSLSIHCKEAASKARRMLFMMRRSLADVSVSAFAAIFNTLVRPHLEQTCSPNFAADADYLEKTQRLATRFVKGCYRLRRLGLHSLRRSRLRGDHIVVCEMFSAGLDLDPAYFFYFGIAGWLERSSFRSSAVS